MQLLPQTDHDPQQPQAPSILPHLPPVQGKKYLLVPWHGAPPLVGLGLLQGLVADLTQFSSQVE